MAWRTRWLLYAALAAVPVVGGLGGMAVAASKAPTYSAEARLGVVLTDLQTSQQLAANFSRFLTPESVYAKLDAATARQLVTVGASPIPDSNMIRVEAEATGPVAALDIAKVATTVLQNRVVSLSGRSEARATLAEYTRMNRQVAIAQEKVNASGGRGAAYTENAPKLAALQAQAQALNTKYQNQTSGGAAGTQLSLVRPAVGTVDNSKSRRQIYLLAGFGGGALLAYVIGRLVTGFVPVAPRRTGRDDARAPELVDVRSREERAHDRRAEDEYATDGRLLYDDPYAVAARYATEDESFAEEDHFVDDEPVRAAAPAPARPARPPAPARAAQQQPVQQHPVRQPQAQPLRSGAPAVRPQSHAAARPAAEPAPIRPARQPAGVPADLAPYGRRRVNGPPAQPSRGPAPRNGDPAPPAPRQWP